jgi:hypothetical protein
VQSKQGRFVGNHKIVFALPDVQDDGGIQVEKKADTALTKDFASSGGEGPRPYLARSFDRLHDRSEKTSDAADEAVIMQGQIDVSRMSAAEKAKQLPRRMWMIIAAACGAWAVVIAIGYAMLG